jgi:diacylglycerol kinase (ATP)
MRRVVVLINPAAGKERPILAPINRALAKAGIDWDAYILKRDAEADAVARAVRASPDALWVYGGDGTISRVASALVHLKAHDLGMAVVGGGTANALAEALDAPTDLEEILDALCEGRVAAKRTDVGMVGERVFLSRASIGATAGLTDRATREEKERLGLLAYGLSGLRALGDAEAQRFRVTVDGQALEHEAISVVVAKSAGTGLGTALASEVEEQDRRLHVFVVPNLGWVTRALANAALGEGLMDGCARYHGQRITVSSENPVNVHLDGESIGRTPVTLTVNPAALTLLHYLPAPPSSSSRT